MKDRAFIDTNVLIYLYSEDEFEKRETSKSVFSAYFCVTSTQVLNELSNVLIKKFKVPTTEVLAAIEEIIENCEINVVSVYSVKKALDISDKYRYSYYDSLILASALENECKFLITEDMQDGQIIDKCLTILNIF
ncbi:MAG: PIN domain-containing protein [Dethiobacter sp.]|jgi:predicted nucleic acid-binding protein|nr:PIN domain-containing protein [Dethiobacter sp.]